MAFTSTRDMARYFLAGGLARHGEQVAILTEEARVSYRELGERVAAVAQQLSGGRRLVLLAVRNELDVLVHYLGALAAGHVVLLVPDDLTPSALMATYDPDVLIRLGDDGAVLVTERRLRSAHDLHPELALLLSTSGSTGAPKLVRLSYENLAHNAESIVSYLGIRSTDRAITTLPLSYCYGLSVLHSHLLAGAGIILSSHSVLNPDFWRLFRRHEGTSLAGVPYTFDLLERVGFDAMSLPHLRYVTQAGGRLAPHRVRELAALGQASGWDFFVMYGQTEATARMAYLPPSLAVEHPDAVGVPVPGGSFRIEPVEGGPRGGGELIYSGANVMLGYANGPEDLALGRTVTELRTGDLARVTDAGLYEIVGRRSRFAKVFGLRIDLARLENELAERGRTICCSDGDGMIDVVVEGAVPAGLLEDLGRASRLPPRCFRLACVPTIPRLANGKPDLLALASLPKDVPELPPAPDRAGQPVRTGDVVRLFATVLQRDATPESTFVSLGGDSLSYVELSLRLEDLLGHLPPNWHTTTIAELAGATRARSGWGRNIEIGVLLRAVGIVLVVGSHANVFDRIGKLEGAAHVLIAVAGYNVARFYLTGAPRLTRLRRLLIGTGYIALPSAGLIAFLEATGHQYPVANIFLLNGVLGPHQLGPPWQYWFLEALVALMVVLALLLAVPVVDRFQRRTPFGFAAVLFATGLTPRVGIIALADGPQRIQTAPALLWLFALGLGAAAATRTSQRWALTAGAVLTVPGFFGEPRREAMVIAGVLLLIWVRTVRCPKILYRGVGVLAANSLYIYLTHWQVFPHLQYRQPLLALAASLVVGIAYGTVATFFLIRIPPVASAIVRAVRGRMGSSRGRAASARVRRTRGRGDVAGDCDILHQLTVLSPPLSMTAGFVSSSPRGAG